MGFARKQSPPESTRVRKNEVMTVQGKKSIHVEERKFNGEDLDSKSIRKWKAINAS